jgi:hypothetical protein
LRFHNQRCNQIFVQYDPFFIVSSLVTAFHEVKTTPHHGAECNPSKRVPQARNRDYNNYGHGMKILCPSVQRILDCMSLLSFFLLFILVQQQMVRGAAPPALNLTIRVYNFAVNLLNLSSVCFISRSYSQLNKLFIYCGEKLTF